MKSFILMLLTLISPCLAYSWGSNGHMTGGAIAYYYLKQQNPVVKQNVVALLKKHPYYKLRWIKETDSLKSIYNRQWQTEMSKAEIIELDEVYLFMLASRWPDDVRTVYPYGSTTTAKWHYIDIPFVPEGQPKPADSLLQIQHPNVEDKLGELLDGKHLQTIDSASAIDLCWVLHLIEDIHEPMHAAGMIDTNHKTGDLGGNLTTFSIAGGYTGNILHSYWDDVITGPMHDIPLHARWLLSLDQYQESKLYELKKYTDVHAWIWDESHYLATTKAYLNGYINGIKGTPGPLVDTNYALQTAAVAERQIVLAGIRLAQKLIALNIK